MIARSAPSISRHGRTPEGEQVASRALPVTVQPFRRHFAGSGPQAHRVVVDHRRAFALDLPVVEQLAPVIRPPGADDDIRQYCSQRMP